MLPPFSSSPNFIRKYSSQQQNKEDSSSSCRDFHYYFHTAPFGTLILCTTDATFSLPAAKFVSLHCSPVLPFALFQQSEKLLSASSSSSSSQQKQLYFLFYPLPVMISEPCVTSMMRTCLSAGSSFAAATLREKFTRIRLSVSKCEYFCSCDGANEQNSETWSSSSDPFILILWCVDPALASTEFLIDFFDAKFPLELKQKSVLLKRREQRSSVKTRKNVFNNNYSAGTEDGDPIEASSSCCTLVGFSIDCYKEICQVMKNILFNESDAFSGVVSNSGSSVLSNDDFLVTTSNDSSGDLLSSSSTSTINSWVFDTVPESTLQYFKKCNQRHDLNQIKLKNLNTYLENEILRCTCTPKTKCCEYCTVPLWSQLLPHQCRAVLFGLNTKFRCLLGDPMGCGKTLEALALLRLKKLEKDSEIIIREKNTNYENNEKRTCNDDHHRYPLRVIIVCPATARIHWAESCEKWLGSRGTCLFENSSGSSPSDGDENEKETTKITPEVVVVSDSASAPKEQQSKSHEHENKKEYEIVITSFAMLVRLFSSHFENQDYDLVIIDESHVIRASSLGTSKNQHKDFFSSLSSQQAVCCAKLCRKNYFDDDIHSSSDDDFRQMKKKENNKKKNKKGVLLLSGTPLLSKPYDCWAQVELLRPGLLGRNSQEFASNYLSLHFQPFLQTGPCHRSEELRLLLLNGDDEESVIVRTEKSEALRNKLTSSLQREIWRIDIAASNLNCESSSASSSSSSSSWCSSDSDDEKSIDPDDIPFIPLQEDSAVSTRNHNKSSIQNKRSSHQQTYQRVGMSKVKAAFDKVMTDIVEDQCNHDDDDKNEEPSITNQKQRTLRIVLFAHHVAVLDQLATLVQNKAKEFDEEKYNTKKNNNMNNNNNQSNMKFIKKTKISFVRIDGSVLPDDRHRQIAKFHRDEEDDDDENESKEIKSDATIFRIKFAIVSITAAGVAISLHKANHAVFVELPPDSTWLRQCEDRLHRMSSDDDDGRNTKVGLKLSGTTSSYLCIDRTSVFDAKHIGQLFNSLESVGQVYQEKKKPQQQQLQASFDKQEDTNEDEVVFLNKNTTRTTTTKSKFFSSFSNQQEKEADDNILSFLKSKLKFQVSLITSRLHFFLEVVDENDSDLSSSTSLFSCAFDEVYSPSSTFIRKARRLLFFLERNLKNITIDNNGELFSLQLQKLVTKTATDFINLWNRHLRSASKALAPSMSLDDFQRRIAESKDGFVNFIPTKNRNTTSFHFSESGGAVFERYLGKRLSDDEKKSWTNQKGNSSMSKPKFLVVTLVYNRTVFLPSSDEKNKKQQGKKEAEIDLLVKVEEDKNNQDDSLDITTYCLYCQSPLPQSAARQPARFTVIGRIQQELLLLQNDENRNQQDMKNMMMKIKATDLLGSEWIPFCSGECRNCWMMKRVLGRYDENNSTDRNKHNKQLTSTGGGNIASARLRSSVVKLEKGVCASCGLDTLELLRKLNSIVVDGQEQDQNQQSTLLEQQRFKLLQKEFPILFAVNGGHAAAIRLCKKPVEGNIWNADHEVPVHRGGGAAVHLEGNLQTLCVACHLAKSNYEKSSSAAMKRCEIKDDDDDDVTNDDDGNDEVMKKESGKRRKRGEQ